MNSLLPKVLLISDGWPSANGMGARRTLHNLFATWPKDRFAVLTWKEEAASGGDRTYPQTMGVQRNPLARPRRFRSWVRTILGRHYSSFLRRQTLLVNSEIKAFAPDLCLVYAESPDLLTLASIVLKQIGRPHVVYLMDDIIDPHDRDMTPEGASVLARAHQWLTISEPLAEIISRRWKVPAPESLVVHNPVDPLACPPPPEGLPPRDPFVVAYAGSIWPMHADALLSTAAALAELRSRGVKVIFRVFTSEFFWQLYQAELACTGAEWGGFVSANELTTKLQSAGLLLVCSSFSPEMETYARSSLQTKITDYMTTGRALLSVGPPTAISHRFIERWECGYIVATNNPEQMVDLLERIIRDPADLYRRGEHGYSAALSHFTQATVSKKVADFLTAGLSASCIASHLHSQL